MADIQKNIAIVKMLISANRRHRKILKYGVLLGLRYRSIIKVCLFATMILFSLRSTVTRLKRSCTRLERNYGWWEMVWTTYDNNRFKKTFRVTKETFLFNLQRIRKKLERENFCEYFSRMPPWPLFISTRKR